MDTIRGMHRRHVANFIDGKLKELQYHLDTIISGCDNSLHLFSRGLQVPSKTNQAVVFGFSAFANVVQTLKDATKIVTGMQLPWSAIEKLRHGTFMRHARNAATHDGNPVVSAWIDGRYHVPRNIIRVDDRGEECTIVAPTEDIRTLCLEFAEDLCLLVRETLLRTEEVASLNGASVSMAELEEAVTESQVMPEFAKRLFERHQQEIATKLSSIEHNPIDQAIDSIERVIGYCASKRQGDSSRP